MRLILVDDNNTLRILNKHASDVSSMFVEVSSLYHETFEKFIEVWQKDGNSAVKLKEPNAVTSYGISEILYMRGDRGEGKKGSVQPSRLGDYDMSGQAPLSVSLFASMRRCGNP